MALFAGVLTCPTAPADADPGTTERLSINSTGTQGNSNSFFPTLSADGRFVAFGSAASNLVPDDTNGRSDVFVHDRGNPPEAEEEVVDDD
jgi:hypothetical protein